MLSFAIQDVIGFKNALVSLRGRQWIQRCLDENCHHLGEALNYCLLCWPTNRESLKIMYGIILQMRFLEDFGHDMPEGRTYTTEDFFLPKCLYAETTDLPTRLKNIVESEPELTRRAKESMSTANAFLELHVLPILPMIGNTWRVHVCECNIAIARCATFVRQHENESCRQQTSSADAT